MRKGFTLIELMIVVAIIAIIAAIAIPSLLRSRIAANESAAQAGLKMLTGVQSSFRATDADGNGEADYWTTDIAGFYALTNVSNALIKYIDVAFAKADDNNNAGAAAAYVWAAAPAAGSGLAKGGYLFRALLTDENADPYEDTDGDGVTQAGEYTHPSKYAFVGYPGVYGREGERVFIVNDEGVVYRVDNGVEAVGGIKGDYINLTGATTNQWPATDPTTIASGGGNTWAPAE